MWIDLEIPAHFRQQVATDFFLPILEGGKFFAVVLAAMAAFAIIGHKLTSEILASRQFLYSPLEFRTPHHSILGQIGPRVETQSHSG